MPRKNLSKDAQARKLNGMKTCKNIDTQALKMPHIQGSTDQRVQTSKRVTAEESPVDFNNSWQRIRAVNSS